MALRVDDVDLERDRALVERFQSGDDEAFDELYRRYHDRLERFCLKRVGDQHRAEEVAQEAFTRALAALPDLGGEMRFYPWMSVIAARLCVDSHRRESRSEPASDPDPGSVSGGQENIVDAVDGSLAIAALARLAPRHRDVLHLREVEGWSYQRIADHYGVKVGTVETLLFRARRALRREFHLVDGAGLAASPVLGRIVQITVRIRNKMPSWLPSVPSPATVAVAATATAAAVVLSVAPPTVTTKPGASPTAEQALAHTPTAHPAGNVARPAAAPVVPGAITTPDEASQSTSVESGDELGIDVTSDAQASPPLAVTATTNAPPAGGPGGVTTSAQAATANSPAPALALPSADAIASGLSSVATVPTVPALQLPALPLPALPQPDPALAAPALPAIGELGAAPGAIVTTAHDTLDQLVGGLLHRH